MTKPRDVHPSAHAVPCPFCEAAEGEFCKTPSGYLRPSHVPRINAYKKWAAAKAEIKRFITKPFMGH